ncbi:TetR/AcrR family transcriptional regulator [Goodfellowiella coeruleoviolacea]|uniref:TetR/AcrR family transcriptional regulator n=1 Tax=Goodfellowiella coeruleoviolacea TaxID=334858 RepID=UPI0020A44938|nr:TetR/AcrR family transcriptional regulator [Goodfellowiella coeruleoviolacea]
MASDEQAGPDPATPAATPGVRRRRRPEFRTGRPTLTRERIARAALAVLGEGGPAELSMRNVAARLGVSPRALYNYVADRDDLLRELVAVCQADLPEPRLDPTRWRESLRAHCHALRAWYRAHPGLLALARAEDLTPFAAPHALRADDALLGFFLDIGLSTQNAYRAWMITVLQVAGFAEVWDSWRDRPPAAQPAAVWAGVAPVEPDDDLPNLRLISRESTVESPDVLFGSVLDMLISGIEAMR